MLDRFKSAFLLTTTVFLIVQITLAIIAWTASSSYLDAKSWSRWDAHHYISIAVKGYETYTCENIEGLNAEQDKICGNTAWFAESLNYNFMYDGEARSYEGMRFTGVLTKVDGNWRFVQAHLSLPGNVDIGE